MTVKARRRPSDYAGYLLDVDGVLYRGEQVMDGAPEALERLRREGKRVVFVSNSSLRSSWAVVERIRRPGVDVSDEEVLVASAYTAEWIAQRSPGASLYVLGGQDLVGEMRRHGLEVIEDPRACRYRCQYLVVGNDPQLFYACLESALRVLLHGAAFVAVNLDPLAPNPDGPSPATRSLVAALQAMTGRPPDMVIGKPAPSMVVEALRRLGTPPQETLLIGDTIDTDMAAGLAVGLPRGAHR